MELQSYSFNNNAIRVVYKDGEPLFIAKDIAEALEYRSTNDAIRILDEDEKGTHKVRTLGGEQDFSVVTEGGMYSLILRSNRPEAKAFKKWVTNDVIPSIRKRGAYLTNKKVEEVLLSPDTIIKLAQTIKEERAEKEAAQKLLGEATAKIEADASKVLLAESITASGDFYLIKEAAVYLTQNGYPVGQNQLFERLRFHGFLGQKGMNYNLPNHRGLELKLFHVKKTVIHTPDGQIKTRNTTYLTGRGLEYFLSFFLNQQKRA